MMGRIPVTEDLRKVIAYLTLLRIMHNSIETNDPVYHSDIAEYIGLKSKSTLINYESGHSVPRLAILSKWLEFWGLKLAVVPIEKEVEDD